MLKESGTGPGDRVSCFAAVLEDDAGCSARTAANQEG